MHLLPLAWQQPACVSLAGVVAQMFEMARVMNCGAELTEAETSLATVFFSHSRHCLLWPDQRPPSPGLQDKHLQSCWTVLSCSINVTLVVRYFCAEGGRTQTINATKIALELAKGQTPQSVGGLNILPGSFLSSRSLNKWGLYAASQNTHLGWFPSASF